MGRKRTTKGQRTSLEIPGLGRVDGRRHEGRYYGRLVEAISSDLGGADQLSQAQRELIRRAAGLSILATIAEAKLLNGEPFDVAELVAVGNAQRRLLTTLGLSRVSKEIPTLDEYLRQQGQQNGDTE